MSKRVCIIGGGPAGVMAAIFASKNHSVTVFEKDEVLKIVNDIINQLNIKCSIRISDEYLSNDFSVFIDIL